MQRAYDPVYWQNYPSTDTPLNETNLLKMGNALEIIDERVCTHEVTKLDKSVANGMVKDVVIDKATGKFTITYLNGTVVVVDTNLEKLAVNFKYDASKQQLVITLDDGTYQYVDMSALITQVEFVNSDIIAFTINADGSVTATIKNGSITADKLEPNYLANVTAKAELASQKASEALNYAQNAEMFADRAEQASNTAGWAVFDIDDSGHLIYTKSDKNLIDFQLTNGRLEVIV